MKIYFVFGLLVSLLLVLFLIKILITLLRVNWNHNNQKWYSYLFPVIIAIVIAWSTVTQLYPRLMDLVQLANGHYNLTEAVLTPNDIKGNHIVINDTRYYHSPLGYDWPIGDKLQIMSSPNMNYVIRFTAVKEASPDDANHP
ncbi:MAG: hypothetical protein GX314_06610 [Clostridiaceae bacterium]|jgi:uncharacterized membrane protein YfhO|nr:hypothetical protein [Clostridiaceae bacterium]